MLCVKLFLKKKGFNGPCVQEIPLNHWIWAVSQILLNGITFRLRKVRLGRW